MQQRHYPVSLILLISFISFYSIRADCVFPSFPAPTAVQLSPTFRPWWRSTRHRIGQWRSARHSPSPAQRPSAARVPVGGESAAAAAAMSGRLSLPPALAAYVRDRRCSIVIVVAVKAGQGSLASALSLKISAAAAYFPCVSREIYTSV